MDSGFLCPIRYGWISMLVCSNLEEGHGPQHQGSSVCPSIPGSSGGSLTRKKNLAKGKPNPGEAYPTRTDIFILV